MGALLFFICVENKSVSVVVYGRTVALTPRAAVFFYLSSRPQDWHGSDGAAVGVYSDYVKQKEFSNV
jgi:hypothetical protein